VRARSVRRRGVLRRAAADAPEREDRQLPIRAIATGRRGSRVRRRGQGGAGHHPRGARGVCHRRTAAGCDAPSRSLQGRSFGASCTRCCRPHRRGRREPGMLSRRPRQRSPGACRASWPHPWRAASEDPAGAIRRCGPWQRIRWRSAAGPAVRRWTRPAPLPWVVACTALAAVFALTGRGVRSRWPRIGSWRPPVPERRRGAPQDAFAAGLSELLTNSCGNRAFQARWRWSRRRGGEEKVSGARGARDASGPPSCWAAASTVGHHRPGRARPGGDQQPARLGGADVEVPKTSCRISRRCSSSGPPRCSISSCSPGHGARSAAMPLRGRRVRVLPARTRYLQRYEPRRDLENAVRVFDRRSASTAPTPSRRPARPRRCCGSSRSRASRHHRARADSARRAVELNGQLAR